ncbi:glycosyltransferase family 2 protein [Histidinibacterium aquaticum]|uniref:Glycosyltransferase family 2 protein n=1 Tax=Histidinibacterium aquaticum TaxID=2613962 RepID=A0A5J5GNI0_9RHOB|nr:glycosyltransferase family 2 protein [Histidinibacterium aquaticum]KAA9009283.1 glycosyltransferase family 2 protein [Histidinibacterium aquaticum]
MASSPEPGTPEAWAAARPPRPSSGDPEVVFAIPLISKARAYDWATVCHRLAETLGSLRAQSSHRWRAFICCQDRPEGISWDEQVTFLPFEIVDEVSAETVTRFDNHAKKERIFAHLAETHGGDGYLFQLDADDLLHPGLVEHIVTDDNGAGYWIEEGYMLDLRTGALAYMGPKSLRHPFAHTFIRECGSSSALRFDFRDGEETLTPIRDRGKHAEVPERMARYGYRMTPVPFPAALYLVGHGENMRQRRGKLGAKESYLRRNRLRAARAREVRNEFGLTELPLS